jgi:hypothetical protein
VSDDEQVDGQAQHGEGDELSQAGQCGMEALDLGDEPAVRLERRL